MKSEVKHLGRMYKVHEGKRGGHYIMVKGEKKYLKKSTGPKKSTGSKKSGKKKTDPKKKKGTKKKKSSSLIRMPRMSNFKLFGGNMTTAEYKSALEHPGSAALFNRSKLPLFIENALVKLNYFEDSPYELTLERYFKAYCKEFCRVKAGMVSGTELVPDCMSPQGKPLLRTEIFGKALGPNSPLVNAGSIALMKSQANSCLALKNSANGQVSQSVIPSSGEYALIDPCRTFQNTGKVLTPLLTNSNDFATKLSEQLRDNCCRFRVRTGDHPTNPNDLGGHCVLTGAVVQNRDLWMCSGITGGSVNCLYFVDVQYYFEGCYYDIHNISCIPSQLVKGDVKLFLDLLFSMDEVHHYFKLQTIKRWLGSYEPSELRHPFDDLTENAEEPTVKFNGQIYGCKDMATEVSFIHRFMPYLTSFFTCQVADDIGCDNSIPVPHFQGHICITGNTSEEKELNLTAVATLLEEVKTTIPGYDDQRPCTHKRLQTDVDKLKATEVGYSAIGAFGYGEKYVSFGTVSAPEVAAVNVAAGGGYYY